jgi:APA family basic amino acid/polyamine antiporter
MGGLAIGTSMMFVMFSYSGWNASGYIAGELKNPRRTLPISLIAGTLAVMMIYLAVNLFIFRSLPFNEIRGTITIVEKASIAAFGSEIGRFFGVLSGIALLASLSAFILLGPRIYFAMARDKAFFSFAAKVHPNYKVPGRSILIQGLIAGLLVMIGSFEQIVIYLEFALLIFPPFAVAGLFIARRKKLGESSAVKTWGYPAIPVFFLISNVCIIVVAFLNRPVESIAAIATILIGIPLYYLVVNRKVRH